MKSSIKLNILQQKKTHESSSITLVGFEKNCCPNYITKPSTTALCDIIGHTTPKSDIAKATFNSRYTSVTAKGRSFCRRGSI